MRLQMSPSLLRSQIASRGFASSRSQLGSIASLQQPEAWPLKVPILPRKRMSHVSQDLLGLVPAVVSVLSAARMACILP
jgi:hypothetical protein